MKNNDHIVCREVRHGSAEYRQTVALRDAILRKPLGLAFSEADLAAEADSFHLACWRYGVLAGCVVLQPSSDGQVRIRQFAVAAEFQRQGAGTALAGYAEAFAQGRGFRRIVLHARKSAVGFYERLGYKTEGEPFLEVNLPHSLMRKTLHPR